MTRRNEKDIKRRERKKNIILAVTIVMISLLSLFVMERNEVKENKSKLQKITDNCASEVVYQIKSLFNNTYLFDFMIQENNGKTKNFDAISRDLCSMYSEVSFVALAPKGIINEVYPANSYGILNGKNLLNDHRIKQAAVKAKNSSMLTITGPFTSAINGEQTVYGLQPVYLKKGEKKEFWGYVVVGVRLNYIINRTNSFMKGYAYKIEEKSAFGTIEKNIYASKEEKIVEPVVSEMEMSGTTWLLSASPSNRWYSINYLVIRIFTITMISIIVTIMFQLIYRDIIRQAEMQAALEEEKERYQIAMESSSDTIFEYDIQKDVCTFFGSILNGKKTAGTHMELENYEAKILTGEMFHYQDIDKALQFFSGEKTEPFETRYRIKQEDGAVKYVWLSLKGSVIYEHGTPVKVIGTTRNIQARKEQEWKKLEESHKDKLTGLYTEDCGRMLIEQYLTANLRWKNVSSI